MYRMQKQIWTICDRMETYSLIIKPEHSLDIYNLLEYSFKNLQYTGKNNDILLLSKLSQSFSFTSS